MEYPADSIYAFDMARDRAMGVLPDDSVFPPIVHKYFDMTLEEFLNVEIPSDTFENFENACYKSCSGLLFHQVSIALEQTLYLMDCFSVETIL